jgi:hypothetical protein
VTANEHERFSLVNLCAIVPVLLQHNPEIFATVTRLDDSTPHPPTILLILYDRTNNMVFSLNNRLGGAAQWFFERPGPKAKA